MRASGNGNVDLCANNLLRTFRGEVPYDRIKGLDPRMIDRPVTEAEPGVREDATWLLETYEPRATVNAIITSKSDAAHGGFHVTADITEKEE